MTEIKSIRQRNGLFRTFGAAALGLAMTACQTPGKNLSANGEDARYRDEIGAFANPSADPGGMDPVAAAAFWSVKFDRDPSDWRAAVNYSAALRKLGSIEQAVRVIVSVAEEYGDEPDVAFEAGKALIEAGRAFEAIRHIENADRARPNDWRILSAFGVALDQIGEHELARTKYQLALTIAPDQVNIMNNKGLSYAMAGDLGAAAQVLRAAAARPGADARVRQNLALVLAIKGDMGEAERLARSDLPPQVASGNIEYFRSLVVQPSYWTNFSPDEIDAPDFAADDVPPAAPVALTPATPAASFAPFDETDEQLLGARPAAQAPISPEADSLEQPATRTEAKAAAIVTEEDAPVAVAQPSQASAQAPAPARRGLVVEQPGVLPGAPEFITPLPELIDGADADLAPNLKNDI